MSLFHLLLLALIQGLTEFLPISSSAHLIIWPGVTGMADQGQIVDVSVHLGTLGAVMLYFRQDVGRALAGIPDALRGRIDSEGSRLAFLLGIATVPVILFGLLLNLTGLDIAMRSVAVIGWAMLLFGIVLWVADRAPDGGRRTEDWTRRDALVMGLWQAVALIPGSSRSGTTITGARFLGYGREDAAKLSMLMSIPTIIASATLILLEVAVHGDTAALSEALVSMVFAFFAALLSLTLMMRLLKSVSFTPYVIYRIVMGVGLLVWAYT